jgi:hypothetical protein
MRTNSTRQKRFGGRPTNQSKLIRLEKFDLPTDDDLNSPTQSHLSCLADYAYSEVPPDTKPADIILNSLKDIPAGAPIEEIGRASEPSACISIS